VRGDCCGLGERGEPRLRRVKDAWAEGSAGLRVTSKQRQIFSSILTPPEKGKSQRRSIPFLVSGKPVALALFAVSKGTVQNFRHRPGIPYTRGTFFLIKKRPIRSLPVQASSKNFACIRNFISWATTTFVKFVSILGVYRLDHNRYIANRQTITCNRLE
jgi:hypothetical protein